MAAARSIFGHMPLARLLELAKGHRTQKDFLRSLGFSKRGSVGLTKRLRIEKLTPATLWPDSFKNAHRRPTLYHALDLAADAHAYFYGLALSDGSLRLFDRNRGYVAIELNIRDASILGMIAKELPWKFSISSRTRSSPFNGECTTTTTLRCHAFDLRTQMIDQGFPTKAKAHFCSPPSSGYNEAAFWRGVVDGDGSVGFTADGIPFISLTTASAALANAYLDFISQELGVRPRSNRNARDSVWNIMVVRENARSLARSIYAGPGMAIARKREKALLFLRP